MRSSKPRSRREPYSETLLIRMRESALEDWKLAAEECDRTLSDWIRYACEHAMKNEIGMED